MSVHVDEVETRVVPAAGDHQDSGHGVGQPRPGAEAEAWAEQERRVGRDGRRTAARGFDD
jgi:hypothetical protein